MDFTAVLLVRPLSAADGGIISLVWVRGVVSETDFLNLPLCKHRGWKERRDDFCNVGGPAEVAQAHNTDILSLSGSAPPPPPRQPPP